MAQDRRRHGNVEQPRVEGFVFLSGEAMTKTTVRAALLTLFAAAGLTTPSAEAPITRVEITALNRRRSRAGPSAPSAHTRSWSGGPMAKSTRPTTGMR